MGNSKLALVLLLFTVLVSSALAQQRRPEEIFRRCQQKCQSQSQYGRGQIGQYECQMRCVRELERQTGRGDRDIDMDVNESRGYEPKSYDECLDRCSDHGSRQRYDCVSRCMKQQRSQRGQRQGDDEEWDPQQGGSGGRGGGRGEDYERYDECMERCGGKRGYQQQQQQQQCMRRCMQRQQGRREDIVDMNESRDPRGTRGYEEEFGECVAKCSGQPECILRCQQEQEQGRPQDNREWDPEDRGRGGRGGQGYERYSDDECMQRCSRQQPGQRQQHCIRQCQQQQQQQRPQRGSEQKEYSYECIKRCERRGEDPYECRRTCIQRQGQQGGGRGRGRGGDVTGLDSILKLTAGLFN